MSTLRSRRFPRHQIDLSNSRKRLPLWHLQAYVIAIIHLLVLQLFSVASAFVGKSQIRSIALIRGTNNLLGTTSCKTKTKLCGIKGFRAWFESQFPDAIAGIPSKESQEYFDHVLIDINQLLHVAVRRSTSDDHALAILMKELNACIDLATPTKSLVLAMDGPPSAAKLATSRKRRLSTLVKAEWKQAQLVRVQRSPKLQMNFQKEKRLRQRYDAEVETLRITPGTKFMERANQAMLYWAWQRMIPQDGPLSKVAIYISSSESPGEGEVKLLDWILRKRPKGTLAIMGGDSDLVLEGLVIPPSICTHNVFVLLPGLGKRYLVVSLWETTRHLAQLLPQLKAEDIMRVRTDMVLLLILNGNDYLPKLRGSSGFNRVFRAYICAVREWIEEGKDNLFLVNPDSLSFNLEFAVDFFGRLKLDRQLESAASLAEQQVNAITPLGQLNNLLSTQFMPKPMRWKIIYDDSSADGQVTDAEDTENDDEVDESDHDDEDIVDFTEDDIIEEIDKEDDVLGEEDEDEELLVLDGMKNRAKLRLTLGKVGTPDYHCYEARYHLDSKIKDCKNELARKALEDLLGEEFLESASDSAGPAPATYSWELNFPVESDTKLYLGGLLWNLQTYQDGICADYSYNYGKRLSPTAEDLVVFFAQAIDDGRSVGRKELLSSGFSPPVKNGVSCLAALPSQLGNLIAEPYSLIPSTQVEAFYAACVSNVDNSFDLQKFSALCEAEVVKLEKRKIKNNVESKNDDGLKKVTLGEDYWTVVMRAFKPLDPPFAPPPPMVEKFTPLFVNRRIKAARFPASTIPRERKVWIDDDLETTDSKTTLAKSLDFDFSGVGDLLSSSPAGRSVFDVDYWIPFVDAWRQKSLPRANVDVKALQKREEKKDLIPSDESNRRNPDFAVRTSNQVLDNWGNDKRVKKVHSIKPQDYGILTSPLAYLSQLEQAHLVSVVWGVRSLKKENSCDPHECANLELIVRKCNDHAHKSREEKIVIHESQESTQLNMQRRKEELASKALTILLSSPNKAWFETGISGLTPTLEAGIRSKAVVDLFAGDGRRMALAVNGEKLNGNSQFESKDETPVDTRQVNQRRFKRLSDADIEDRIKAFNLEIDPLCHPLESKSGVSPLSYLVQLEQAEMIDCEWKSITPSYTDFASISPHEFECVQLTVRKGDASINSTFSKELIFQRDREVTRGSKQQVKQYLASMALTRLIGHKNKKWFEMSFLELKNMLIPDYEIIQKPRLPENRLKQRMIEFRIEPMISPVLSITGQNALDYLWLLHSDNLINITFTYTHPSPTEFASLAPEDFELVQLIVTMSIKRLANPFDGELVFERDRLVGRDQRQVKQFLAAVALSRLMDHVDLPWTEFTYEECRSRVKAKNEIIP